MIHLAERPWTGFQLQAIGTSVHVLVTERSLVAEAEELTRAGLAELDLACSRFRADSELVALSGRSHVGPVLAGALQAALDVAHDTGGLVVPTLGRSLRAAGYDRTYLELPEDGPAAVALPAPPEAWRQVQVEHDATGAVVTLPAGVELDLGATAKAWAADRLAEQLSDLGTGVLVNLGGDLAVAGPSPLGGWPVEISDRPEQGTTVQVVAVTSGGLATSSTTARRWLRGGVALHHVLDPATGLPAPEHWASVSVVAPSCLEANAASTAAVVLGTEAPAWLLARGLPAVLLARSGEVLRLNGWPEDPR